MPENEMVQMVENLSEDEAFQRFLKAIAEAGGVSKLSHKLDVTPTFLYDIRRKRAVLGGRVAEYLGLRRVVKHVVSYEATA